MTKLPLNTIKPLVISTHILTKRMTFWCWINCVLWNSISTHILTKRMTFCCCINSVCVYISTHILTKRMTAPPKYSKTYKEFQLTSSRRGWPADEAVEYGFATFQLTSSRRGWHHHLYTLSTLLYFNSHPHEEDDCLHFYAISTDSIFQLTSSRRGWP